jgi:S-adenosylmethionine hydrolase
LITNFTALDVPALFEAQVPPFKIFIGKSEITSLKNSYTEGGPGEIFAILGSMGYLEISTNRGSAAQMTGIGKGGEVNLTLAGSAAAANG